MKTTNSTPCPKYRSSLGPMFIVFVTWPWMNTLLNEWGYRPYRGWGLALGFGIIVLAALLAWLADYALFRLGIAKTVRAGLWMAATLGPGAGIGAFVRLGNPMWSQIAGLAATFFGFGVGHALDSFFSGRNDRSIH